MKKLFITGIAIMIFQLVAFTQGPGAGGFQRQTVEERVAAIHNKLDSAFKLAPDKLSVLDTALTVLYKAQDKRIQEIMSGGERPDREAMMAERKKYTDARDEMIKAVVTAEQYTIWIDKIEPSMRPVRPQGMGDRNRQ